MATEDVDPRFADLDAWPFANAIEAMWDGQLSAIAAIRAALPAITRAAADAADALKEKEGRLVYVGAGTSGRVAVQDGAELTPTFDWPLTRVVFLLAGGPAALTSSIENAEDDVADGIAQIDAIGINRSDVVIGVAASGTTPFTVAAVKRASELGAVTIGIANNPDTDLLRAAKHPILIETGSELIAGSTRMKAGTSQKVVLNLISSGIMIRLGRIYRGMMVNMRPANAKLKHRAEVMVMRITGCSQPQAARALTQAHDDIKVASLIALGHGLEQAKALLERNGGNLRMALAERPGQGGA